MIPTFHILFKPDVYSVVFLNSNLDTYHKKIGLNKLHILETMQKTDSEYFKLSQWLDTFLQIPFNTYKIPTYMTDTIKNNPSKYLLESRQHLDTVIYGQNKTKQHINLNHKMKYKM